MTIDSVNREFTDGDFSNLAFALKHRKKIVGRVVTGSMEPLIMTGSVIDIEPLSGEAKKFDIIVFQMYGKLICHYIWHRNQIPSPTGEPTYTTRPLAGAGEDFPCEFSKVLGQVTNFSIPRSTRARLLIGEAFRKIGAKLK